MKEPKPVAISPSKLNAIGFAVFGIVPIKQQSIFYLPFAFSVDPLLGVRSVSPGHRSPFSQVIHSISGVGGVCSSVPRSGYFVVFEIALRLDLVGSREAIRPRPSLLEVIYKEKMNTDKFEERSFWDHHKGVSCVNG